MLPLPASLEVSRFSVRFRFLGKIIASPTSSFFSKRGKNNPLPFQLFFLQTLPLRSTTFMHGRFKLCRLSGGILGARGEIIIFPKFYFKGIFFLKKVVFFKKHIFLTKSFT